MRRQFVVLIVAVLVLGACADTGSVTEEAGQTPATAASPDSIQPSFTTTTIATTTTLTMETTMHVDEGGTDRDDGAASHEDVDRTIEVIMTEFAFSPDTFEVAAGETIEFVVHNAGAIQHELRLTTKHAAQEHLESGHDDHDAEESEGGHGHDESLVIVEAGETGELVVTFGEAGSFDVVACLLPGHYEAGMLADLTVEG